MAVREGPLSDRLRGREAVELPVAVLRESEHDLLRETVKELSVAVRDGVAVIRGVTDGVAVDGVVVGVSVAEHDGERVGRVGLQEAMRDSDTDGLTLAVALAVPLRVGVGVAEGVPERDAEGRLRLHETLALSDAERVPDVVSDGVAPGLQLAVGVEVGGDRVREGVRVREQLGLDNVPERDRPLPLTVRECDAVQDATGEALGLPVGVREQLRGLAVPEAVAVRLVRERDAEYVTDMDCPVEGVGLVAVGDQEPLRERVGVRVREADALSVRVGNRDPLRVGVWLPVREGEGLSVGVWDRDGEGGVGVALALRLRLGGGPVSAGVGVALAEGEGEGVPERVEEAVGVPLSRCDSDELGDAVKLGLAALERVRLPVWLGAPEAVPDHETDPDPVPVALREADARVAVVAEALGVQDAEGVAVSEGDCDRVRGDALRDTVHEGVAERDAVPEREGLQLRLSVGKRLPDAETERLREGLRLAVWLPLRVRAALPVKLPLPDPLRALADGVETVDDGVADRDTDAVEVREDAVAEAEREALEDEEGLRLGLQLRMAVVVGERLRPTLHVPVCDAEEVADGVDCGLAVGVGVGDVLWVRLPVVADGVALAVPVAVEAVALRLRVRDACVGEGPPLRDALRLVDALAVGDGGLAVAERVREAERERDAEAEGGPVRLRVALGLAAAVPLPVRLVLAVREEEGGGRVTPGVPVGGDAVAVREALLLRLPVPEAVREREAEPEGVRERDRDGPGLRVGVGVRGPVAEDVRDAVAEALPRLRLGDGDVPLGVGVGVSVEDRRDGVRCGEQVALAVEVSDGVPEPEAGDAVAVVVHELAGVPEGEGLTLWVPEGLGLRVRVRV